MKISILSLLIFVFCAGCSRDEISKENDSVDKASTYVLREERQRVVRYDCNSQIVSDQVETTRSPVAHMSIHPKETVGLYSTDFTNLTLNTRAGSIVDHSGFTIDWNPGALNMKVQEGVNQIEYKFWYCDQLKPIEGQTDCAVAPVLRESGQVFINVTYELRNLDGVTEYRKTPEECQPPK